MATQNYHSIKNAALITPATATDLGSVSQPYGNLYLQGNLNLGTTAITSTSSVVPKISSLAYPGTATAANPAGGETITINGSGFLVGINIYVAGIVIAVTNRINSTQLTFTSTAKTAGSYTLSVVNSDGGTANYQTGLTYSALPVWSTASGSLGTSLSESGSAISNITLSATENAQSITYAVTSGSLPTGLSLSSSGVISGTITGSGGTYNFTVTATDPQNQTATRNFSYTVTTNAGQQAYITAGSYSWTAPAGITSVSVVCVGGGGCGAYSFTPADWYSGGGGGALAYKNNITVIPGNTYAVVVGANGVNNAHDVTGGAGGDSSFNGTSCKAGGGAGGNTHSSGGAGGAGGTVKNGDGGGAGGDGGDEGSGADPGNAFAGGGGAGGYSGAGGKGANGRGGTLTSAYGINGQVGSGGGGAGGTARGSAPYNSYNRGGGVGILGQGTSGDYSSVTSSMGGSGAGTTTPNYYNYGAGVTWQYPYGGDGAVRIIWPGNARQFPSTRTADE